MAAYMVNCIYLTQSALALYQFTDTRLEMLQAQVEFIFYFTVFLYNTETNFRRESSILLIFVGKIPTRVLKTQENSLYILKKKKKKKRLHVAKKFNTGKIITLVACEERTKRLLLSSS